MDPDRWKRLNGLFDAASERPAAERDAFLKRECAGDEALEQEIRALLASAENTGSFLEEPPWTEPLEASTVTHLAGRVVSHYRILEMLGAGGMGVVYKGYDERLARPVALKFLPPHLRDDPELKKRLMQEARAASNLDHPNIVVVHDVGETSGGDLFVAMAFHEGLTLRERIERDQAKGMPVDEALHIARQIAAGLAKAHERGILHRDIKPGNVIVDKEGVARIIDFGLAKTSLAAMTADGTTKGTPLYMSPEQASGKPLDARTDLWSLGVVLYEMFAGRPPFQGEGHLAIMHAIVYDAPRKLAELRPDVPAEVERIVMRALEKDPARRYQTAGEMVSDLSAALGGSRTSVDAPRHLRRWTIPAAATAGMLLLATMGAAAYFRFHLPPKLTNKDTILLADFDNRAGDPIFDDTLRQGLEVQLLESPFLSLVSTDQIQKTLELMGKPKSTPLTGSVARDICERTNSAALLAGSISRVGSQYVLGLRAINCHTGAVLNEQQVQVAKKEDVIGAITQVAVKFRAVAGESLATVERYSTPLEEAATPSLEALKAYSLAGKVRDTEGHLKALPLYKKAIEIDPEFASAHAWLGRMYAGIGEFTLGTESAESAWRYRSRASDHERFYIDFSYYRQVKGDLEKCAQICEAWIQSYPRDHRPHGFLSGSVSLEVANFQRVIQQGQKTIAIDPDIPFSWGNVAGGYVALDNLAEAKAVLQKAAERKIAIPEMLVLRYQVAFLENDQQELTRLTEAGYQRSQTFCEQEAHVAGYAGELHRARTLSAHGVYLARQGGRLERAAQDQAGSAIRESVFGNAAEARRQATAALHLSKGGVVEFGAGFALGLSGDAEQAGALASDLERRFPEDTTFRTAYVPVLRALTALGRHDAARAVAELERSATYELAFLAGHEGFNGSMYAVYVRGMAYLEQRRGLEAAAEFEKILKHRGIVLYDPIGAVSRWRLGEAYALAGDTQRAKVAYDDFLTLWKNADSDVPILKEARSQRARLL